MHRRESVIALALAGAGLAPPAWSAGPTVEVFTLSTLPLTNVRDAVVYYVDTISLLKQQLSTGLPPDPRRAQALATQRIASLGAQLQSQARAGANGLARAAQLGVQRAPAIVFEGRWVVYGLTDVDAARRVYSGLAARDRR